MFTRFLILTLLSTTLMKEASTRIDVLNAIITYTDDEYFNRQECSMAVIYDLETEESSLIVKLEVTKDFEKSARFEAEYGRIVTEDLIRPIVSYESYFCYILDTNYDYLPNFMKQLTPNRECIKKDGVKIFEDGGLFEVEDTLPLHYTKETFNMTNVNRILIREKLILEYIVRARHLKRRRGEVRQHSNDLPGPTPLLIHFLR